MSAFKSIIHNYVFPTELESIFREPSVLIILLVLASLLMFMSTLVLLLTCVTCYCRRNGRGSKSQLDKISEKNNGVTPEGRALMMSLSESHSSVQTSTARKDSILTQASTLSLQTPAEVEPAAVFDFEPQYSSPADALQEAFPGRKPKKIKGSKPGVRVAAGEATKPGCRVVGEAKKAAKRARSLDAVADQPTYDDTITALSYRSLENKNVLYENFVVKPSTKTKPRRETMPGETTPMTTRGSVPTSRRETMSSKAAPRKETARRRETTPAEAADAPREMRVASVVTVPTGRPPRPPHSSNAYELGEIYQNLKEVC